MAKLIIECSSLAQAKVLAEWYEGAGEQSSDEWLENCGIDGGAYTQSDFGMKIDYVKEIVRIKVK
jgi:hypothetical protein